MTKTEVLDLRLTDEFFLGCVEKIGKTIAKEENRVRVGMGGALMSIGKRNKKLNAAAIKLAKAIGPIHFSDGASLPFSGVGAGIILRTSAGRHAAG